MRDVDAFQLGYLPYLIAAQFDAVVLITLAREGASPDLLKRIDAMTAALPMRGPEVVSCVWQVARVMAANGVTPAPEPRSPEDAAELMRLAWAAVTENASTFAHAKRVGAAERTIDNCVRLAVLMPVAPEHPVLVSALGDMRASVAKLLEGEPPTDCPTTRMESAMITVALQRAAQTLAGPVRPEMFVELATAKSQISTCARSLESVARGTPRVAIQAWFDKKLDGAALIRRVAEHYRWSLLVRTLPEGIAPRTMTGDTGTAIFAFSDRVALDAKPAFLASDREDEKQVLTVAGAVLLKSIPDDVDALVLDANENPDKTINYRRTQAMVGQVAGEVAFELAATNWSMLDPEAFRSRSFWVLVAQNSLQVPLARDGYGRQMPAVYSTEEALEAHLASLAPEARDQYKDSQRLLLAGQTLFSTLAQGAPGFMLNPVGAGRSRMFNRGTLELLATPPAPKTA